MNTMDLTGRKFYTWLYSSTAFDRIMEYGDRFTHVGIFKFLIDPDGTIHTIEGGYKLDDTEWQNSGQQDSKVTTMHWKPSGGGIEYTRGTPEYEEYKARWKQIKEKWPHIRMHITIKNDGARKIWESLGKNWVGTDGTPAQTKMVNEIRALLTEWDWIDGIDYDFERGAYCTVNQVLKVAQLGYNAAKEYNKYVNWCLPPMEGPGTPSWEAWCDYSQMHNYFDTAVIMSYAFAWSGSAPGPISPQWWMDEVYNYAYKVIPKNKLFLGIGGFGFRWNILQKQEQDDEGAYLAGYRGRSGGMSDWYSWMNAEYSHTDQYRGGAETQPYLPFAAYFDDTNHCPYMYLDVYDYLLSHDRENTNSDGPVSFAYNQGIPYSVTYSKRQAPKSMLFPDGITTRWVPQLKDSNYGNKPPGAFYPRDTGISLKAPTSGEVQGVYSKSFIVQKSGTYKVVFYIIVPFFGKDKLHVEIDGKDYSFSKIPWYWQNRTGHQYYQIASLSLSAGEHTVVIKGPPDSSSAFVIEEIVVAPTFNNKFITGSLEYTAHLRKLKGWMHGQDHSKMPTDQYAHNNMFKPSVQVLRRVPDYHQIWPEDWRYRPAGTSSGNNYSAMLSYYDVFFNGAKVDSKSIYNAIKDVYPNPLVTASSGTVIALMQGGDFPSPHIRVQYSFSRSPGGNYGVIVGATDEKNFWMVQFIRPSTVKIFQCSNGTFTEKASGTVALESSTKMTCEVRVRNGIIKVYKGNSDISGTSAITKVVEYRAGITGGSIGFRTKDSAIESYLFSLSDAWRYSPRESYTVTIKDRSGRTLLAENSVGRINRRGVTYDSIFGSFTVNSDIEEDQTRDVLIPKDWDFYFPDNSVELPPGDYDVVYRADDIGVWMSAIYICDADGASIVYFNNSQTVIEFMNQAKYRWGLTGTGYWVLSNEDVSLFDQLPSHVK